MFTKISMIVFFIFAGLLFLFHLPYTDLITGIAAFAVALSIIIEGAVIKS